MWSRKLTCWRPVLDVPGAVDDGEVLSIARRSQRVSLLQSIQVADGHVLGVDASDFHAADEPTTRSHAESHRGLVTLFLDRAGLEVEDAPRVLWLLSGQLLANLFSVLGVDHVEQRRAVPVILRVIQHRSHRVGNINYPAGVAGDDEQESVGCLQDEMLELLIGQERWFVASVGVCVASS